MIIRSVLGKWGRKLRKIICDYVYHLQRNAWKRFFETVKRDISSRESQKVTRPELEIPETIPWVVSELPEWVFDPSNGITERDLRFSRVAGKSTPGLIYGSVNDAIRTVADREGLDKGNLDSFRSHWEEYREPAGLYLTYTGKDPRRFRNREDKEFFVGNVVFLQTTDRWGVVKNDPKFVRALWAKNPLQLDAAAARRWRRALRKSKKQVQTLPKVKKKDPNAWVGVRNIPPKPTGLPTFSWEL